MHDITITSYLTDYPSVKSAVTTSTIEILDACPDPHSVTAPDQTNPPDYFYSGSSPSMTFTLTPFHVDPSACINNIAYTCTVISGSRTDLCSVSDG